MLNMLNEEFVLKSIEPRLNAKRELSEFEFFELFSGLERQEQYEVINIMIKHDIDYVDEKEEETETLSKAEVLYTMNDSVDYKRLLHLKNEQLCVMAQDGDSIALAALIDKNKRFVYQLALKLHSQYYQTCLTVDDLYQEGNIGLIEAAQRFNVSLDFQFLTYSWHWIRQKITRAAIDTGYTIRIPVHMYEKIVRINVCRKKHPMEDINELLDILNTENSADQHLTKADLKKYLMYAEQYLNTTSLNTLVGEGEETELMDFIADDSVLAVEDIVFENTLQQELEKVLKTLKPREEKVLRLRFGLNDGNPKTLEEVGQEFNVTRERIRQIEAKALRKLRHPSRSKKIRDYLD